MRAVLPDDATVPLGHAVLLALGGAHRVAVLPVIR